MMKRSPTNPILTRADIPDLPPRIVDVSAVFNPGAVRVGDRDFLLLRVQTRGRETVLMVAESADGERFSVRPRELRIEGIEDVGATIYHIYDPRLTRIDGTIYVVFAADTDEGCRLGVARVEENGASEEDHVGCVPRRTDSSRRTESSRCVRDAPFESVRDAPYLDRLVLVGFGGKVDTRNGVLFPERFDGRYLRLERPNRQQLAGAVASGSQIVLAESDDLIEWRELGPVMAGRPHYWDELIGSGPPPVKTRRGWLHIYHGIATHFASVNIYQAGVVLLDLADPRRVLARGRDNILEPREPYELTGQVPNVVFPSGMIVEEYDAEGYAREDSPVRVYYGAADTVVGLATTTVGELLAECDR